MLVTASTYIAYASACIAYASTYIVNASACIAYASTYIVNASARIVNASACIAYASDKNLFNSTFDFLDVTIISHNGESFARQARAFAKQRWLTSFDLDQVELKN